MSNRNIADLYPLAPMQQGMLFHSVQAPDSGVYFEQLGCVLRGNLNVRAFRQAWDKAVERHSILRTAFVWEGVDEPLQAVHRQVALPWREEDWRGLSAAEQKTQLEAYLAAERRQGFDLTDAPLMRFALLRLADDRWQFIWNYHHLLLDGWSMPLLMQEVLKLYQAFARDQAPPLASARPYRDYIAWLQHQDKNSAENFWRELLRGFNAPTPLLSDPRPEKKPQPEAPKEQATLSVETTAVLQALARAEHLTMNTIIQGAWALLLARYSGEDDIVFGATVSGRPTDLPGAETMIGLFINTLPVRARVNPDDSALALLKQIQRQQAEARQYEYCSLIEIQGWSEVQRGLPLFETILVYENYPVQQAMQEQRGELAMEEISAIEQTNYPLCLVTGPGREQMLYLAYDATRYSAATIRQMLSHLCRLLEAIAANPAQPIGRLPLLSEAELKQILADWNDTARSFPAESCAHQLFEAQAARTPEAIAVAFEDQKLTYRELNAKANQVTHYLQRLGVGPEAMVSLCVERTLEMIVGVLGILKSGAAYVPLDPAYPADRISLMLAETNAPVLLTQASLKSALCNLNSEIQPVCLDTDWPQIAEESTDNPKSGATADNLAYVIFTSGSTGRPKGTLLEHRGLCNFALALAADMGVGAESRVLQFGSLSFDGSVAEIFPALLGGATLVLARRETLVSMPELADLLRREAITTALLPPSVLRLLPADNLPSLATVVSVGEACTREIVERWAAGRRFFNGYGPTEVTVGAAWNQVTPDSFTGHNVPIGRPVPNAQIYILDRQQQPVPIGVPGEICVGGAGLARGYLNRPELTAEKFIHWHSEVGIRNAAAESRKQEAGTSEFRIPTSEFRLYRTGDLARWLPDGRIEFVGRLDEQVKLRGLRIEPGEIEAVLLQHPAVREAAVLAREDAPGDKRLVAYLTTTDGNALPVAELRELVRQSLPEYMIPAAFVTLAEMPLLPNGKINRRALPAPDGSVTGRVDNYVAPRTPVEELLCEIGAAVLGVERVGIQDNFFELGGHSLLATQFISRVREAFNLELPLQALFEAPVIAQLAPRVEAALQSRSELLAPPITPVSRDAALPLSFSQQRLWFLDQLEPHSPLYNNPSAFRLKGRLDINALERSLNEIIRRHEALRTSFSMADGQPVQVIAPRLTLELPLTDLRHLPEAERAAQAQRLAVEEARCPFDLSQGLLLRASLAQLDDDDYVMLLTIHHIVSDGWSISILLREVITLYTAFVSGAEAHLPELPVQYADYAKWQRDWLRGEVLQKQLDYWTEKLRGRPTVLELPTDRPRPGIVTSRGATYTFALSKELQTALVRLSRQEGVTMFMTLLAAFQTLLARYSNQNDISVGTTIASRTRGEIENLIGFFVNTLVLHTDLSGDPSFTELLARARETALGAYAHQELPFEMLVEALQPERDLSHTPLFQVMFTLNNTPMPALELPDLKLLPFAAAGATSRFDLTLMMSEGTDGMGASIEYNTDLFDATTIERLAAHFRTLLEAVADDPEQPVSRLPLLAEAEQRQLLVEWNDAAAPYPAGRCFHQLVEERAAVQPEAIAVEFDNQQLTYRELDARANQLAHHLRRRGVMTETIVGICTDRSLEMIVGILGVMKAGAAYLPLDPYYPIDRLTFMFADSQAQILLTQNHLKTHISNLKSEIQLICLDSDWPQIAEERADNSESGATADNLAYVIYTSGSTGQPKGTLLEHRGLCNLAIAQQKAFNVQTGRRVLQFSPFSFDASVWEMTMALASGATLVLARQESLISIPDLHQLLRAQRITHVTLPPSVLALLVTEELPELEVVIAAGERCTAEIAARWSSGRRFFNAYGPTETTVCAAMHECSPDTSTDPPIGRPLPNFTLFVLDHHQQPVPIGVPGELCVGGVALARGYLHRPELTAEKFIHWNSEFGIRNSESPAAEFRIPNSEFRLYRTGDQVRWLADGTLEYLGRIDEQVKIRGFRIELGEIEAALRQHAMVRDVVVAAREDVAGDKRLVAYLINENGVAPNTQELKNHLRQKLPEYMIPLHYLSLDKFPLSPSGKVDRKRLPAPDGSRPDRDTPYVEPRTDTEKQIALVWGELLGLERVGIHDNFFELGGHSLLATRMVVRLREAMQVELPLRTLFEFPTLAAFAEAVVQASRAAQAPAIVPLAREARRMSRSSLQKNQLVPGSENTGDQQAGLRS